ncbi:MAG: hypothetical protein AAGF78_07220 [Pseudomonadota bacterium]
MSSDETKSTAFDRVPVYYTTLGEAESLVSGLHGRVELLEGLVRQMETQRAVDQEKQKFIEERFNRLDQRLVKIEGHTSRLVWLIIAAIIGGLMSFVMRGGVITI